MNATQKFASLNSLDFLAMRFQAIRREQPTLSLGAAMDAAIDSAWYSQEVPAEFRELCRLWILSNAL